MISQSPKSVSVKSFPITVRLDDAESLNRRLIAEFEACRDDPVIRRSHLFEGRYENIYVTEAHMPSLRELIDAARNKAAQMLNRAADDLSVGAWMNAMEPGHVTLPHTHDDDDELLSGVYYIAVPESSGDLLLSTDEGAVRLEPEAGMLAFFPPDMEHEVTRHQGMGSRLSLGLNFGFSRHQ